MTRNRYIASAFAVMTGISLLAACDNLEALTAPCYSDQNYGDDQRYGPTGWKTANGIHGAWHLVSVNGNALPYQIPFSQFSPGGVIIAKGGGITFRTDVRGWDDDCSRLHSERGTATATVRYSQAGVDKPQGLASGAFYADHDNNSAILTTVDATKSQNVTLTRDPTGEVIRITATDIPVKKWGLETTFTLVFEPGYDYGYPAVVPP